MLSKRFKIIYMSDGSSQLRELNLTRWQCAVLGTILSVLLLVASYYGIDFLTHQLYSGRLTRLEQERQAIWEQLHYIEAATANINDKIHDVMERDDEMRVMADIPPLHKDMRNVGVGGTETEPLKLSSFFGEEENYLNTMTAQLKKLERQINLEVDSYQEIYEGFQQQKELALYFPSLRPVEGGRQSEGFRQRIHPITGKPDFHSAVDLSVPYGTEIIAPANGVVVEMGAKAGYGNYLRLDHDSKEFGFQTAYGHLSKFRVRLGQKVTRGQVIGEVGKTGMATAPHLHYEVIYNGKPVNPISYYYDSDLLR